MFVLSLNSLLERSIRTSLACHRLTLIDGEWHQQYHYKRRMNIVLSDLDTVNTCDRPFVKLLRIYCFEWNCQSKFFEKFQVEQNQYFISNNNRFLFLVRFVGIRCTFYLRCIR